MEAKGPGEPDHWFWPDRAPSIHSFLAFRFMETCTWTYSTPTRLGSVFARCRAR